MVMSEPFETAIYISTNSFIDQQVIYYVYYSNTALPHYIINSLNVIDSLSRSHFYECPYRLLMLLDFLPIILHNVKNSTLISNFQSF